jgi:limonene-1,2-epoxide hydrolase
MTDQEARREQQARRLFEGFGEGPEAVHAAIREVFAEDCIWVNGPIATTTGPEEAIALMVGAEERGVHAIEFEVLNLAVRGDVVFAERIDHARDATGNRGWSVPVVGVLEFEGDKLAVWREYFDPGALAGS